MIALYGENLEVLKSCTDEATIKAAIPKLTKTRDAILELSKKQPRLSNYLSKNLKSEFPDFEKTLSAYGEEFERLKAKGLDTSELFNALEMHKIPNAEETTPPSKPSPTPVPEAP